IEPEGIPILVQDENLRLQPQRQHPFPLRHDGHRGTDDAEDRIAVSAEFAVELLAPGPSAIVAYAKNARGGRVVAARQAGVTRDEVDPDVLAVSVAQARENALDEKARAAFYKK